MIRREEGTHNSVVNYNQARVEPKDIRCRKTNERSPAAVATESSLAVRDNLRFPAVGKSTAARRQVADCCRGMRPPEKKSDVNVSKAMPCLSGRTEADDGPWGNAVKDFRTCIQARSASE